MQTVESELTRLAVRAVSLPEPYRDAVGETALALARSGERVRRPAAYTNAVYRSKVAEQYAARAEVQRFEEDRDMADLVERLADPKAFIGLEQFVCRKITEIVREAIPRLRSVEQHYLQSVLFHGTTCADVSRRLGLSPETGRTIFRRARLKIIAYVAEAAEYDSDIAQYISDQ